MQSIPLAFYYHAFTFGMSSVVYTFKILQKYSDYMTITKECKIISAKKCFRMKYQHQPAINHAADMICS